MAATPTQITNFLLDLTNAQSDYGKKVALHAKLGRQDTRVEMIKLTILSYCIQCLEKYFNEYDYENHNFFTEDEAQDIMERINEICGTFIYLEL
jgi:hypothetical protein